MSGNEFLLDTNAVLYVLNGDETLSDFLFEKKLYISVITEIELLSYKHLTAKEKQQIKDFIKEFVTINISDKVKHLTIELKRRSNMKLPDSIIAGTAMALQIPFVTSDKQFRTIGDLNLIFYEK